MFIMFQAVHEPYQAKSENFKFFPDIYNYDRLNYVSSIKNIDDGIGQILESLEAKGALDKTIILFSSDNGGTTGPGYVISTCMFERNLS